MRRAHVHVQALPPADSTLDPTVGALKRALHELPHAASGAGFRDYASTLREVHDLMRRLARLNGIDPDSAVQRSRDAVQSRRERMAAASAIAASPVPGRPRGTGTR